PRAWRPAAPGWSTHGSDAVSAVPAWPGARTRARKGATSESHGRAATPTTSWYRIPATCSTSATWTPAGRPSWRAPASRPMGPSPRSCRFRPTPPSWSPARGGAGLTAVATLRALGHRATCAVDRVEANLAVARELGASLTVAVTGEGLAGAVLAVTGGPVAAVIDFVNNELTASAAFDVLSKGGTMVQVGLFGGELTIPTALLALKMITVQGSFVGTLPELGEVL